MTVITEGAQQAAEITERHPGWIVWNSRPTATRASRKQPPRNDGVFAMTVEASSWPELDELLTVQDQADEDYARGRT
jgi:hypothetical protein